MCRLYTGKKTKKNLQFLYEKLESLELSQGGNGNGISYFDENMNSVTIKGVNKTTKELIDSVPFDTWFIFHTRLTSHGSTDDANSQPFEFNFKNNKHVLMHNGTINIKSDLGSAYYMYSNINYSTYNKMSDTHLLSKLIELKSDLSLLDVYYKGQVFVIMNSTFTYILSGKPFFIRKDNDTNLYYYTSELKYDKEKDNAYKMSSECLIKINNINSKFTVIRGKIDNYEPIEYNGYGFRNVNGQWDMYDKYKNESKSFYTYSEANKKKKEIQNKMDEITYNIEDGSILDVQKVEDDIEMMRIELEDVYFDMKPILDSDIREYNSMIEELDELEDALENYKMVMKGDC